MNGARNAGKLVRIGGACGFWGDSSVAVPQLVRRAPVDYITFDYLAELTMSILAGARAKNSEAGWATDFVDTALAGMLPEIAGRGIRLLTNAGGMNPRGCAAALAKRAADEGVRLRIAIVEGDDVSASSAAVAFPQRLLSANAYLGAFAIAAALDAGADVVITGRCVDSALPLAALVHEFGWAADAWHLLAAGSLAGHLLECGAQGSGGLHTDWERVERWHDIGYPVAECAADGTFVVTKPAGTGGLVVPAVVAEQMLYEIGDPAAYVLPDVVCDFRNVELTADGEHRVRVVGAAGTPRPDAYKVAATYADGFRCVGTLVVVGIDAARKARRTADAILARTRRIFSERGFADYSATNVEVVGAEHLYGPHSRATNAREVMLRLSVDHADRRALEIFAREIAPAGTSWSPGTTGAGGGRPKPSPLVKFASFAMPRGEVRVTVSLDGEPLPFVEPRPAAPVPPSPPGVGTSGSGGERVHPDAPDRPAEATISTTLLAVAWARSGDKGDTANIGVVARAPEFVAVIREQLTEERVAAYFAHLVRGPVVRYDVPGIRAFNFVLHEALGGGGMASMRIDPLAKGMAQMALDIPLQVPASLRPLLYAASARGHDSQAAFSDVFSR